MTLPTMLRLPLDWYIQKLERHERLTSLIYGDGELMVAAGDRQGELFTTYREAVTPQLRNEMLASLAVEGPDIVTGTDLNLIDYMNYRGGDLAAFREKGEMFLPVLRQFPDLVWADGTVWEEAVAAGELGPLLRVLRARRVVLVGNCTLKALSFLHPVGFVEVLAQNAFSMVDWLERATVLTALRNKADLVIVCMGLGATPLIVRLRARLPAVSFLDLGSVFDVFVGGGAERGWREEIYKDPPRLKALLAKNLKGLE